MVLLPDLLIPTLKIHLLVQITFSSSSLFKKVVTCVHQEKNNVNTIKSEMFSHPFMGRIKERKLEHRELKRVESKMQQEGGEWNSANGEERTEGKN